MARLLPGAILALSPGLSMGMFPMLHRRLNPVLQILRSKLPIAYITMAMVWFGIDNATAIFLIAGGTFLLILLLRVILPSALPAILNGMCRGVGTTFIVIMAKEMMAAQNRLGFHILRRGNTCGKES